MTDLEKEMLELMQYWCVCPYCLEPIVLANIKHENNCRFGALYDKLLATQQASPTEQEWERVFKLFFSGLPHYMYVDSRLQMILDLYKKGDRSLALFEAMKESCK